MRLRFPCGFTQSSHGSFTRSSHGSFARNDGEAAHTWTKAGMGLGGANKGIASAPTSSFHPKHKPPPQSFLKALPLGGGASNDLWLLTEVLLGEGRTWYRPSWCLSRRGAGAPDLHALTPPPEDIMGIAIFMECGVFLASIWGGVGWGEELKKPECPSS